MSKSNNNLVFIVNGHKDFQDFVNKVADSLNGPNSQAYNYTAVRGAIVSTKIYQYWFRAEATKHYQDLQHRYDIERLVVLLDKKFEEIKDYCEKTLGSKILVVDKVRKTVNANSDLNDAVDSICEDYGLDVSQVRKVLFNSDFYKKWFQDAVDAKIRDEYAFYPIYEVTDFLNTYRDDFANLAKGVRASNSNGSEQSRHSEDTDGLIEIETSLDEDLAHELGAKTFKEALAPAESVAPIESVVQVVEQVVPIKAESVVQIESVVQVVEQVVPIKAETVAPIKAETVVPIKAETVAPIKAETVVPIKAETVVPIKAETVVPIKAETVASVVESVAPIGVNDQKLELLRLFDEISGSKEEIKSIDSSIEALQKQLEALQKQRSEIELKVELKTRQMTNLIH
jgi:hypothetical protein